MEKRYGHKIRIAVRNHALPEGAWENGMDILEWAKRGYFDMYICSPRWRTMDNDMPVYLWKQMLSPYGIEVAGGLEVNIQSYRYGLWEGFSMTTQTSLGSAAYILSEGADKLYLFNYFGFAQHFDPEYDDLDHPLSPSGQKYFLSTAGDLDKILKEKRKCVSAYRDFNAIWRSEMNGDLPVELTDTAEPVFVHVKTGDILPGSKVLLHLGISGITEQDMEVYVNSVPVKLIGKGACEEPVLTESCVYTFEVLEEAIQPLVQVAEIVLNTEGKKAIVDYTDFTIE